MKTITVQGNTFVVSKISAIGEIKIRKANDFFICWYFIVYFNNDFIELSYYDEEDRDKAYVDRECIIDVIEKNI